MNILFYIQNSSHFVELARVARLIQQSNKYSPIIIFRDSYPTLERDMDICKTEAWEFIPPLSLAVLKQSPRADAIKHSANIIPTKLRSFLQFGWRVFKVKKIIKAVISQTRAIAMKYRPALMIFPVESASQFTHVITRTGHQYGIPSVIIPFAFADVSGAAEVYYNNVNHIVDTSAVNKLVGRLYPHWVHKYRGRELLRLHPDVIVALETSGFHHPSPWINNSDDSSTIFAENERMFKFYRNQGLPENRLVVTGALSDDILARGLATDQNKFYRDMNLRDGYPLLLCALPQNFFPRECEFTNYEDLLQYWMQTLASLQKWNVLVRPHPRLSSREINFIQQFGVSITQQDTAAMVPLCDLYVTSVSTTIRWAIACSKPVINYDVYQMGYQHYVGVDGVLTMNNKDAFLKTLNRITTDSAYYDQVALHQKESATRWGRLDGKSSERIMKFIDDIITQNSRSH